ncbi:TetR/AcrR family transcriptional regulator [Microbacterium sp. Mu-80]|uniref:TetR/AcrR family transcriptional regulator n=1 Tax=Microbacterium bandirmense TaxID=3122050 RepID=A0ABU8LAM6_9MICO
MPTRARRVRDAGGRPPTATEVARRRQILDATISIVGRAGWAACTLQSVADEIGVTKAAVIYHVGTKAGLVEQAYSFVIDDFVAFVQVRLETAGTPLDAVVTFALAHLEHMREHRDHARLIAESLTDAAPADIDDRPTSVSRTAPAVALIDAARAAAADTGSREPAIVVATVLNGMVDAAVAAWLQDPGFDLDAAGRLISVFIRTSV